jgi:hypothetical protein
MSLPKEITTGELASLLGVSTRNVGLLTEKGVLQKLKHGVYNLQDSVRAYVLHRESVVVEKHAVGEHGQLQTETLRQKLKLLSLDVAERERQVIPVSEVVSWSTKYISVCKDGLLALPTKLAPRLVRLPKPEIAERILREAIIECLTHLQRLLRIAKNEEDEKKANKK